ncbi:MAG TPA: efflux RND transporter periplasmic adaptor subunit [Candidatus Acidoferrum sp.]|jgi:HlyD family secretion protein|nr:efflux RND transporter periplasmic adaptor subunit [Candidatus Acidoferrum sp.]
MDRKLRNRTLLFLALAAVVAFALVRLSGRQPVAKISATTPVRQNIVSSVSSNGKVEPISPYTIRAELDTFVEKVLASEGQNVKKGQLLLRLDVKDATSQLAAAKARLLRAQDELRSAQAGGRADEAARINGDLAKAQAELDRRQRNHDSLERLLAQGAATKDELAANDLALAQAQADVNKLSAAKKEFSRAAVLDTSRAELAVEQAQSDVAALEAKVRQGSITAPVDGTLYSLPAKTGEYVKVGDLLAEMADLHRVRVRAFVDEPEMGGLEPGLPVKITWDALPNRTWEGKTEIIPRQVVARGSRSVGELLCSVDNEKLELLPNTNVNVRIHSKERVNVVAVSRGAVERESGQSYVFVVISRVGKTMLEKRPIQVGIADATNFEVMSGLQAGEVVALPGDVDLKDGMVVKVVNMDMSNIKGDKNAGLF